MNDDLISRSALKEYKFTTQIANGVELEDIEVVPVAAIDNAPTVEYPEQITVECVTEEDKQKLLSELRNARLQVLVEDERPQGSWIEKVERRGCFAGDKTVYSYTCPFCGAKEFKKYPFCHCGADMRVKSS